MDDILTFDDQQLRVGVRMEEPQAALHVGAGDVLVDSDVVVRDSVVVGSNVLLGSQLALVASPYNIIGPALLSSGDAYWGRKDVDEISVFVPNARDGLFVGSNDHLLSNDYVIEAPTADHGPRMHFRYIYGMDDPGMSPWDIASLTVDGLMAAGDALSYWFKGQSLGDLLKEKLAEALGDAANDGDITDSNNPRIAVLWERLMEGPLVNNPLALRKNTVGFQDNTYAAKDTQLCSVSRSEFKYNGVRERTEFEFSTPATERVVIDFSNNKGYFEELDCTHDSNGASLGFTLDRSGTLVHNGDAYLNRNMYVTAGGHQLLANDEAWFGGVKHFDSNGQLLTRVPDCNVTLTTPWGACNGSNLLPACLLGLSNAVWAAACNAGCNLAALSNGIASALRDNSNDGAVGLAGVRSNLATLCNSLSTQSNWTAYSLQTLSNDTLAQSNYSAQTYYTKGAFQTYSNSFHPLYNNLSNSHATLRADYNLSSNNIWPWSCNCAVFGSNAAASNTTKLTSLSNYAYGAGASTTALSNYAVPIATAASNRAYACDLKTDTINYSRVVNGPTYSNASSSLSVALRWAARACCSAARRC